MLEDYVFSDKLRYEGHVLYYNCPAFMEPTHRRTRKFN